ncbi:MAG: hypothetical protein LBH92_04355 [Bacteroidales bacterium]|jgi:DNA-binding NarL/FixJ family response regulator|nr:hypothetical protein [Bacteroidales bacterium]
MKKIAYLSLFYLCAVSISAQNREFDSILHHIDENSFFQFQKSKEWIDELYQIAYSSSDSLSLLAICIAKEAKLNSEHSIIDTLLKEQIHNLLLKLDDHLYKTERNLLNYSLGLYNYGIGNYGEAFIELLQTLKQFKELKDTVYIFHSMGLLGSICNEINQPHLSNEYFTNQLIFVEENSLEYFRVQQNRYILLAQEEKYDQFIDSLHVLLLEAELRLNDYQLITICLNLSNAYLLIDSLKKGYDYLQRSRTLMQQIDNDNLKIGLNVYFGDYLKKMENYQEAIDYYRSSYQQSMQDNRDYFLRPICYGLASCFEALHEKDSAIYYLERYRLAIIHEEQQNKSIKVHQQYISNYSKLVENQLIVSQQAVLLRTRQMTIIIISFGLVVSLLLLTIIFINQQKRRKKLEANVLSGRMQYQQEIISLKERQLASSSLSLTNKNDVMKRILTLIDQNRDHGNNSDDLIEKIDEIIRKEFKLKKEWENFKIHFENVHPNFFSKLKTIAPNLTEENLKMCAYFRIGLSIKDVSNLLGVMTQSVFNQRNRIKKKLNLSNEDDLNDFLKQI